MSPAGPLRVVVWPGMPDEGGLALAAGRIGRELDVTVISSNEDLEARLESEAPFDLITPSDYLVEKLAAQGRLSEMPAHPGIDRAALAPWARNPAYDPQEQFSVPLAFGTTGLLYRSSEAGDVDSWQGFFEPAGYPVGILNEMREVIGAALIHAGESPNTTGTEALAGVARLLERQRPSVASRTSDDFTTPVEDGTVAVHHAWSGPAAMAVRRTEGLAYTVPREGGLLWVTTAAIPANAPDPDAAVGLLAELMDPEVAAMAVENGGYSTPNGRARALLPADLREDPVLFPPVETIERCQTLTSLSADQEAELGRLWQQYERS